MHPLRRRLVVPAGLFLAGLLSTLPAASQQVPTGQQEYFILGYDQHLWDMMDKVENGEGGGPLVDGMNSVVTAVASADRQVVYYDHWEDGFEADVLTPLQPSTLVLGDADPANGDACDFSTNPTCAGDVLLAGDFVNLASDGGLGAGCTVASAQPALFTNLCSSVPVNPRCAISGACTPDEVRFDGGDFLLTSGGPLSLNHTQFPLTPFIGGSTEILSRQAVQAARSYSVPVGEDLYVPNSPTEPFHYVDLDLVAFEDGTQILVQSPGAGSVSFTLDRGEHWTSLGSIDDGPFDPSLFLTINAGTKVSTSAPINGLLFTGGDGTWATRHYALLPDILHSTDYIITAPGDDPTTGPSIADRPAVLYIFNPDPLRSIDVTVTDSVGSAVVSVPPNSSLDYFTATGRFIPSDSTVRLTSDRNFWGVTAYDHDTNISDWGHSWLATKFLTNSYTVGFAPGNQDPTIFTDPTSDNLNAVFVAATADGTEVRIDLDNDSVFDAVDLDGDGTVDPAPLPGNTYLVNALEALRIFDPFDLDNTGTRIVANKPVAVAWGQDTELTGFGDIALDTGYTAYPINQLFLDPVLVLDKEVDPPVVPLAGGVTTYTLALQTFGFSPIENLEIYDLLPPGVAATDYVPGSTLITYPDLTQETTDPIPSIDPATGRERLDWTLDPDSMTESQTLTVRYSVDIPPAPGGLARTLINEGHGRGTLGASLFEPLDTAELVQTEVTLSKGVDSTLAEPGDILTYTLLVTNQPPAESNPVLIDPIPSDTTFVPGSIVSSGPFSGTYDAAQNAVVWTATTLPPGTLTLGFQVQVNPTAARGTRIENRGSYQSDNTPLLFSNRVETVVVAPQLVASKSGPPLLHPNEIGTFEITVENTGNAPADQLTLVDPLPTSTTVYVAESMLLQRNANPFVPLTDAVDADAGALLASPARLAVSIPSLGPGENLTLRFELQVLPGTAGQFVNNQATVSSDEISAQDTNLVQVPIVGDADVTGHVFLDLDGNGIQDPGEPDLSNVDVVVTDAIGNVQVVATDAGGDYLVTVEPGSVTLDVDETDPDFPSGAVLTTANDPQVIVALAGVVTPSSPVGYDPPPLVVRKSSNAPNGRLFPGDLVTYTVEIRNTGGVAQTGVAVSDPIPAGMLPVAGSTQVTVSNLTFRVTEYFVSFPGTQLDLTLNQALAADYFVLLQGSDGNGTTAGTRGPDENYAALTQDPFGTGQLGTSPAADVLRIERLGAVDPWVGVVTVVECLSACTTDGFVLRDARRVAHPAGATSGSDTAASPWTDIGQTMLAGGFNGAGCTTAVTGSNDTKTCHVRLFPSGADQIGWTRDAGGATLGAATSTVLVVEWGSSWTVQRVRIQGNNGGDGADSTAEYNTAAIGPVARDATWVWGTGHTNDQGIGDAAEGVLLTLGDGVNQLAAEGFLAAGLEVAGNAVDFEVYALTHPALRVDHRFKPDGDGAALTVDVAVDQALTDRFALSYNGMNGTGNAYPRPMFSARYLDPTTIRLERRRSFQDFPAWVQGIDFSGINGAVDAAGNDPPDLVLPGDGFVIPPNGVMTVTFQLRVDPAVSTAITQITNVATVATDQEGPFQASVTDQLLHLGVQVEPNNAGFASPGGTVTYSHEVLNTGLVADSYDVAVATELGFPVELLDPSTGAVLAADLDGDGVWDGGTTINTGTLQPGELRSYRLRVGIPAGTAVGTQQTVMLQARSDSSFAVSAFATDETIVIDDVETGPVVLLPDHSGIVQPGGQVVYTHTIRNNTGSADTFDLFAAPTDPAWTVRLFADSNGDGAYTPGVDVEITNSRRLLDGEQQTFFSVVTAPAGALPGERNVAFLSAVSRADPTLLDGASDTTTVLAATTHDLSGGGTLLVQPGQTPVFPGTLENLTTSDQAYDFTVTRSPHLGRDGFLHPTQLVVDTDGDGLPDTLIGEDSDGDGVWDFVAPGFDVDGDGNPDVTVPAGGGLSYELRRPVDPDQGGYRDPVTLTATSHSTGEMDSVTATNLLATATHALITDFRSFISERGVVVEWRTSLEVGTVGFLLERRDPDGSLHQVLREPLPAGISMGQGSTYRVLDRAAAPGTDYHYSLVELEADGSRRLYGPYPVQAAETAQVLEDEVLHDLGTSVTPHRSRTGGRTVAERADRRGARIMAANGIRSGKARLWVDAPGLTFVAAADLAAALDLPLGEVTGRVADGGWLLSPGGSGADPAATSTGLDRRGEAGPPGLLFADHFESGDLCRWSGFAESSSCSSGGDPPGAGIPWLASPTGDGLYFVAEDLSTIYSDRSLYWIEPGAGRPMESRSGQTRSAPSASSFLDTKHFEEEQYPMTAAVQDPESDFWFWDFLIAGNPSYGVRTFTLPTPGAIPVAEGAQLSLLLHGLTESEEAAPDHHLILRLNGVEVGRVRWDGAVEHRQAFELPAGLLLDGDNSVELESVSVEGVALDIVFLDSFDLLYQRSFTAVDNHLAVLAEEPRQTILVDGFSGPDIFVFDTSDPKNTHLLDRSRVQPTDWGSYGVRFRGNGTAFLATRLQAAATATVEADLESDLLSAANVGEYLVLAGPGLEAAAQELVDYRSGAGLISRLVRLQDVYDTFRGGMPDPLAIRDFLRHAVESWQQPPRLVALAGDGSFDYKGVSGAGDQLIPVAMTPTPDGLFPSDHRLADLSGEDGVPELGIGRIPARSADELATYVAKLRAAEASTGTWRKEISWVADGIDQGGEFAIDTEALIPRVPSSIAAERIYVDDVGAGAARQRLLAALQSGRFLIHYLGHGGPDRLASEGLIVTGDVAGLENGERQPILLALTCAVGRFDLPGYDTLSESAVRRGDGGFLAVVAPAGLSFNHQARLVGELLLDEAFAGDGPFELGTLVAKALRRYARTPGPEPSLPSILVLQGDPAMLLKP